MRKNRKKFQGWSVAAFFLLNVLPPGVMAQEDPAKALHKAGKTAMEEGDKLEQKGQHEAALAAYADACQKFGQALALSPKRPTTGMALALCHAAAGKPATAIEQLRLAKEWAETGPASPANAQIAAASAAKISEIEVIVPRLQLKIPENIRKVSGLTISENGKDIPDAKWDTEIFVDPGTILLRVSAPSKNPWSAQVEAAIGKVTDVAITPDWKFEESPPPPPPPPLLPLPPPPSKQRIAGFIGIGAGGVAMLTGAVLGGLALSKNADSKANNHCDETSACDEIGTELRLEAQKIGNASTAMFVVGGVLAATGVILVATAPAPEKKTKKDMQAGLWIGPTGVAIRGSW